jgi:cob(I)alamin adenosyltransferase
MPGYGKRIGPAIRTPEGRVMELERELERHNKLYAEHINELVDCLFEKYIERPDKQSEKLLIMHMGGEFFRRRDAALR